MTTESKVTNLQILKFIKGCVESTDAEIKVGVQAKNCESFHFTHGDKWFMAVAYVGEKSMFVYNMGEDNNIPVITCEECDLYYFPFDFVRGQIFKILGYYNSVKINEI